MAVLATITSTGPSRTVRWFWVAGGAGARTVRAMATLPSHLHDEVAALVGGPVRVLRGPETGISRSTIALVNGPHGQAFVKWPSSPERIPAIQAEARILDELGDDLPAGSPRVLAAGDTACPFLITEAADGTSTWIWPTSTLHQALHVLDRFAALPPVGGPLTKTNIVDIDKYWTALETAAVPQHIWDDVVTFARDLHGAQEVFCHGDAHPDNWIIDRLPRSPGGSLRNPQ